MANAKSSKAAYGAEGAGNLLYFDPDKLVLVTEPSHPLYDDRVYLPIDEKMVRSIMRFGVRQPINVRKNVETGETEVSVGRQRVKNAREANRRLAEQGMDGVLIPAMAVKEKDEEALDAIVAENEIRTADTPLSRANKMARMVKFNRPEEHIAMAFGCTVDTVRGTLALLDCCSAVQKAVEAGKLGVGHAKALSKLKPDEQRSKLEELLAAAEAGPKGERAARQRKVLGDAKPKMKTRKEILAAIEDTKYPEAKRALQWVLGEA
jgi:ParB family chromosome partitioning protein